ncbi:aldehyde dehydrogenase [Candidatus Daviesbacteria bacterium]|nr:aldehyde dehydrogenase [Candidatus Daviesbacteria bacterium]
MQLVSTNPADNYSIVGEVIISDKKEITQKVQQAHDIKTTWKELGVKKRIELLRPICEEFTKRQEEIAQLITKEIGKPISQSRLEVTGYIKDFGWFLRNVESAIADEITHEDKNSINKIVYEPFGVAEVITPWNFPFGMAVWGIIPNLLVGNTVVFKISEECPLVGKLIEEVFQNHSLPKGVFAEVYGSGEVGKKLSESNINFIWFTGSTKTGKSLYKTAADKFIKVMLEMGGSNPCIVFDDANLDQAAETIYLGRFKNCGQVCMSIKRLIVHESVVAKLSVKLKTILESKQVGNPENGKTDIACLAAKRQLDLLQKQVSDALQKGAKVIAQLTLPKNLKGAYYPPTILGNITKNMRVWQEEVFGPVLPIVTFKTEQEAVELANDTPYGLGSKVLSQNQKRAERVASKIEAGTVEINQGNRWLSCNPFGGYKDSGMGREHGILGFRELCQTKIISSSK